MFNTKVKNLSDRLEGLHMDSANTSSRNKSKSELCLGPGGEEWC